MPKSLGTTTDQIDPALPSEDPTRGDPGAEEIIDVESPLPPVDFRARIKQALMQSRDEAARDERLLSAEGIVEIARELGVQFSEDTFNADNVASFVRACQVLCEEKRYRLLSQAIVYVALGQAALDANELPTHIGHEYEDPIRSYIAAIELVTKWLDAHSRDTGVTRDDVDAFRVKRYTDAWNKSVNAAKAVAAGVVGKLRDSESGEETELGAPRTTLVFLHDSEGRYIGAFPTFDLGRTTLGETPGLKERRIEGTRAVDYASFISIGDGNGDAEPTVRTTGDTKSFLNRLFPGSEFPDRELLEGIEVETVIGVVPIASDRSEALFEVYFDGGKAPYRITIITGENLHGSVVYTEGGVGATGVPSSIGANEEFFSARSSDILSTARAVQAEEIGKEASTSVILVIKPVINGAKAAFRRRVLHYRMGTLSADKLAREILDNVEHDDVLWLQNAGWLTGEQAGAINDALTAERASRAEGEESGRAPAGIIGSGRFRGDDWGSGGEESLLIGVGGGLGHVVSLHTGGSGVSTGYEYGHSEEKFDPDPFADPKILVIKPFGIQEHEEPGEAVGRIADVIGIRSKRQGS